MERDAYYVGLLDMVLLALNRNKDIIFCFVRQEEASEHPEVVGLSLGQLLTDHLPDIIIDDVVLEPDVSSKDTWFVRVTRSDSKPISLATFTTMNHFEPAWHQTQILKSEWEAGIADCSHRMSEESAKISKALEKLKGKTSEYAKDRVLSLTGSEQDLQNDQMARTLFHEQEILPRCVPGDGNCGLWTFLALEHGPGFAEALFDQQDKVAALRQDRYDTKLIKFVQIVQRHPYMQIIPDSFCSVSFGSVIFGAKSI